MHHFFLLQKLNERIDEISASEEKLKELNLELNAQMAQMVSEFDEDKRQAVERYFIMITLIGQCDQGAITMIT